MKIYTKTGDSGTTGLFGVGVWTKTTLGWSYGSVDETNAAIGQCRAAGLSPPVDAVLAAVQNDLFTLGAELACVPGHEDRLKLTLISATEIARLEQAIDDAEAMLTPLSSFVLPGRQPSGAELHAARTTCRRAERRAITLRRASPVRDEVVVYLNRLSDLLFVLARRANHEAGVPDVPWVKA